MKNAGDFIVEKVLTLDEKREAMERDGFPKLRDVICLTEGRTNTCGESRVQDRYR